MGLFKTDLFRSFGLGFAVGAAGFFAISGGVFSDPAASLITPAHAAPAFPAPALQAAR